MKSGFKRTTAAILAALILASASVSIAVFSGVGSTVAEAEETAPNQPTQPTDGAEAAPSYDWYTSAEQDATAYTISSAADLMGLAKITQNKAAPSQVADIPADDFTGKTVQMGANIDLSGIAWVNVSSDNNALSDYRIKNFAGTFDGQNHTISNLSFVSAHGESVDASYVLGLFQTITANGSVKNLTLDGVKATLAAKDRFAPLAYFLSGDASNCHVKNVNVTGNNDGSWDNCNPVGGMFCLVTDAAATEEPNFATVENCSVSGMTVNITGLLGNSGGLASSLNGGSTLKNCSANDISFSASSLRSVGGLLARTQNTSDTKPVSIEGCTADNVTITSNGDISYVGGFSGTNDKGASYTGCTAKRVTITSTSETGTIGQVGGFISHTQNGVHTPQCSFTNCHVTGLKMTLVGAGASNDGTNIVGGFTSVFGTKTEVTDCSAQGFIDTSGVTDVSTGGFLGKLGWHANDAILVQNCTANVDIIAKNSAGGFVGSSKMSNYGVSRYLDVIFKNCTATGSITSTEGAAGGFVGDGEQGTYTDCTATGNVTGVTAGGFWGQVVPPIYTGTGAFPGVTISGCGASGTVLGSKSAGGFLGNADTDDDNNTATCATKVKIDGSTASPTVAGATKDTTVNSFLNTTCADDNSNITLGESDNANTGATVTIVPAEGNTIRNSQGDMVIPAGGATVKIGQDETGKTLSAGSLVHPDGSITIPAGGSYGDVMYPSGATVDKNGNVKLPPTPTPPVTPSEPEKPAVDQVQNVRAMKKSTTWLKLNFDKVDGVDGYEIYNAETNEKLADCTTQNGRAVLTKTVTGLNKGTTYKLQVRAYKLVDGERVYGDFSKVYTKATAYLDKVTGVRPIKKTQTTLKIQFNKVEGAERYKIFDAETGKVLCTVSTQSGAEVLQKTITGLTAGETRQYKVRAYATINSKNEYGEFSKTLVKATAD